MHPLFIFFERSLEGGDVVLGKWSFRMLDMRRCIRIFLQRGRMPCEIDKRFKSYYNDKKCKGSLQKTG